MFQEYTNSQILATIFYEDKFKIQIGQLKNVKVSKSKGKTKALNKSGLTEVEQPCQDSNGQIEQNYWNEYFDESQRRWICTFLTHYNSNQIILGVDMLSNSVDLPELIENKAKDLIIYVFCIDESWNLLLMFINTSIKFYSTCSKRVVSKILQRNFFVESS